MGGVDTPRAAGAVRLLAVVRHARAESGEEGADHERRLTARGRADAAATGRWLAARLAEWSAGLGPVWVSSAVRARSTWEEIRPALPAPARVDVDRALYLAGAREVLDHLGAGDGDGPGVRLVVGHNPTMEHVVRALTGELHGMRPGAAVLVALDGERGGTLVDRWSPR